MLSLRGIQNWRSSGMVPRSQIENDPAARTGESHRLRIRLNMPGAIP